MTASTGEAGSTSAIENGKHLSSLHLCHNLRQLFHALIDARHAERPVTIVYLQDDLPVSESIQSQLSKLCLNTRLVFLHDRDMSTRFANLPRWFPAIVRRNLRLPLNGGAFPRNWTPIEFIGQRFDIGYIYHPGFFSAKTLSGLCDHVVMRESGMNNYIELRVPPLKALLRVMTGMSARRQIWGEERWIDAIEVETPSELPTAIQHKARQTRVADVLQSEQSGLIHKVVSLLAPSLGEIEIPNDSALVLTQPIDELGLCSSHEKQVIYAHLAKALSCRGYRVFVKNHPRERSYTPPGTEAIPHGFPIETWAYIHPGRFSLAVALHSASLAQTEVEFATRAIQLFRSLEIEFANIDALQQLIEDRLQEMLPEG